MQSQAEFSLAQEYNMQGKSLHSVGKYKDALTYYARAEAEDPMFRETYLNQGETYILLERFDEAANAYEKALLLNKKDGEAYFNLGNVAFLMEKNELGRKYYADAVNNGYDDPQMYINLGFMYANGSAFEEAVDQFNRALARDPFRADAWLSKAKVFMQQDKYPEALQALDGLIEHTPDVFEGHHYKVIVLMQQQRFADAQKALDKAIALFPEDEAFWYDQLLLLEYQQKLDEALAYYDAHFFDSENPLYLLEKCKLLAGREEDDNKEAMSLIEKILAGDDQDCKMDAHFLAATLLMREQNADAALAHCQAIIDHHGKDSNYYTALYMRGFLLKKKEDPAAMQAYRFAIAELRMASSLHPDIVDYYLLRANCHKDLAEYDKAFDLVNYLLTLKSDMPEALYMRSELYKAISENDKSREDLSKVRAGGGMMGQLADMMEQGE